jgi:hypothetical protein
MDNKIVEAIDESFEKIAASSYWWFVYLFIFQ